MGKATAGIFSTKSLIVQVGVRELGGDCQPHDRGPRSRYLQTFSWRRASRRNGSRHRIHFSYWKSFGWMFFFELKWQNKLWNWLSWNVEIASGTANDEGRWDHPTGDQGFSCCQHEDAHWHVYLRKGNRSKFITSFFFFFFCPLTRLI